MSLGYLIALLSFFALPWISAAYSFEGIDVALNGVAAANAGSIAIILWIAPLAALLGLATFLSLGDPANESRLHLLISGAGGVTVVAAVLAVMQAQNDNPFAGAFVKIDLGPWVALAGFGMGILGARQLPDVNLETGGGPTTSDESPRYQEPLGPSSVSDRSAFALGALVFQAQSLEQARSLVSEFLATLDATRGAAAAHGRRASALSVGSTAATDVTQGFASLDSGREEDDEGDSHQDSSRAEVNNTSMPQEDHSPGMPWEPTHVAPASGVGGWALPFLSGKPTIRIEANTPLRIIETDRIWAHVETEDGTLAWVSKYALVEGGAQAAAEPEQYNAAETVPFNIMEPAGVDPTGTRRRVVKVPCPSCGEQIRRNATTCTHCGTALLACEECGNSIPYTEATCRYCGTEYEVD